jgi:hypothetical protein
MKSMISTDNQRSWALAKQEYHKRGPTGWQVHMFSHRFLADPVVWGNGRLLPGLCHDANWPIWLYHLYHSMHECVYLSFTLRVHARDTLEEVQTVRQRIDQLCQPGPARHPDALKEELALAADGLKTIEDMVHDAVQGLWLHTHAMIMNDL